MKKNKTILVLIILLRLFSANSQGWPFHNNTPGTITGVAGEIRGIRGNTTDNNNRHVRFHGGVDMITANLGQNQQYKVYAVADGVITWNPVATGTNCWGARVTVGDYVYKHIERASGLISGTNIAEGTYIGTMFATSPNGPCPLHVHMMGTDEELNYINDLAPFTDNVAPQIWDYDNACWIGSDNCTILPNTTRKPIRFFTDGIHNDLKPNNNNASGSINQIRIPQEFGEANMPPDVNLIILSQGQSIRVNHKKIFDRVDMMVRVRDDWVAPGGGVPASNGNNGPHQIGYEVFDMDDNMVYSRPNAVDFTGLINNNFPATAGNPANILFGQDAQLRDCTCLDYILTTDIHGMAENTVDRYWNTRIKRNRTETTWDNDNDLIARAPDEVRFSDGRYCIIVSAHDAGGNETEQSQNILIDNFLPYVQKVEVINIAGLPILQQIWSFNTVTGLIEYVDIPMSAGADLTLPRLRLTFSEKMEHSADNMVQVTLRSENGIMVALGTPVITDGNVYTYPINLSAEALGNFQEYCLEVKGQDLATNELLSFSQLTNPLYLEFVQVSSRDFTDQDNDNNIDEWYPVLPQGTDEIHCFFLGEQNFCPLVNDSPEGNPIIAGNTSSVLDKNLPFIRSVKVSFATNVAYDMYWECASTSCNEEPQEIFITPFGGVTTQNLDISNPMVIEVSASEPLAELEGEVRIGNTVFEMIRFDLFDLNPDGYIFVVSLPSDEIETYGEISQGDFIRMEFTGEDMSGNSLLNLEEKFHPDSPTANDDCTQLPYKDIYGTWQNLDLIAGTEKAHHFGLLNSCSDEFQNEDDNNKSFTTGGGTNDCLIADFEFNFSYDGCTVNFIDYSIGNGISYQWDFGDGAIDYIASPSHYYSESDCYPVTLRITDGNNTTQLTKEVCVNSCGSGSDGGFPECNVNGPSFAAPGQQIILTANGIGVGPFTYSWNVFGLDATIINGIFSPTVELLLSENLSNGDVLEISVDITDASGYSVNCYYPITASGNIPALEALVWSSFEPNEYLYFVGNIDYFNLVGAYNFHFQILNTSGQVIDTYSSGFEFWNYFDGLPTGVYQICVDVTDEVGTYSDCTGFTIGNPAPVDPTPKIELVYMEQIPVLNQYAQSSDYILPEDLEGEAYRLNPENPAVFVWYKTNSYPFNTWVCDDEQKMIIHWRIRDAETGEVLLNAEDIGESNYDCQGDPAIRYIGLNTIDGCFSGSILIDATFYQSESRQQVPPYTTNTDCCPYINLSSNGTGEPNETPYHTDPIRIDIDQGSPEIQNISVASSINNNCNQILTTNVTGGCRMSQSTGAPCYTTQYYEQYSWKIYNILTGEEIEDFLIDNNTTPSNKKCVEIDPSHSFFDDFTTGETPVVKVELQVIDHAGYTAEYSKILSLRIPLKLNPVSSFTRCKGTSASLFSEPYISGGVLPYELSWDSSPYLDVSSNPLNPVLTIPNNFSGTIILGFEGRDAANCSIEHREITINVTDGIQVHPYPLPFATNTPLVTCLYESRRTLGRPDEYGGVATGGSGNYTYEWSPAIGLSNTYEAHPTVAIIPPVSEQNYTLIVTDDTGCTATGDVNVIANEISQVVANAGLDQTVCYDENSETGALLGGNPLYSGVSFASDITWEFDVDGLETYTTMDDQLQIINTDVPGEHTFTLTVIDINNGCFDQDEVKLTILDQWRYTGFNSEIDILRQGQEGNLWQEYGGTESIILSGAVSPLEYEWNPSTENNNLVVWTLDNGIPSSGKFTPTIENPELNLLVTDVFGCQKEFKSNRYILIENKPVVSITSDPQSGIFCKNKMVCFTTEVTFEPVSTNTWLLPPSIPVNHELWIHYANSFNSLELEETNQLLHSGSLNTYLNEICIENPFGTLVGGLNGNYGTFNSLSGLNDQTPFFGELYFLSSDNYSWNQAEEIVCDDTPPWASSIGEVSNKSVFADVVKIERNENCNQLYVPNDDIAPLYENYSGRFEGRLQGRGQVIITNLEVDEGAYFHALINPCYVEGVALKEQPNITIEEQKKKYQVDKKSKNIGGFPSLTAYPNPFYGKTTIVYSTIAEKDKVTLELLDYTGQHIRFLEQNKICYKGVHSYTLNANELPVGLYFVSLHINDVIVDAIKIIAIID